MWKIGNSKISARRSSDDSDLSPYAGEEHRFKKSLSPEEIESLRAGAGIDLRNMITKGIQKVTIGRSDINKAALFVSGCSRKSESSISSVFDYRFTLDSGCSDVTIRLSEKTADDPKRPSAFGNLRRYVPHDH
jgi:hypothetical protein